MQIHDGPHVMNTLDYSAALTNLIPGLTYSFKVDFSAGLQVVKSFVYIQKLRNIQCSQVRARTSVGYGENSTALDITLSAEGQTGKNNNNNKAADMYFTTFSLLMIIFRQIRAISCTTGHYCHPCDCSCMYCFNNCGGSIDLVETPSDEKVSCQLKVYLITNK